jgi:hypothetical protein
MTGDFAALLPHTLSQTLPCSTSTVCPISHTSYLIPQHDDESAAARLSSPPTRPVPGGVEASIRLMLSTISTYASVHDRPLVSHNYCGTWAVLHYRLDRFRRALVRVTLSPCGQEQANRAYSHFVLNYDAALCIQQLQRVASA